MLPHPDSLLRQICAAGGLLLQLEKMRTARTTADDVTGMRNVESIKLYVIYSSLMTRADCFQLPTLPVHNTC